MKVLNISFSEITRYLHFELKTWVKQNVMMRIQISVIWFQNSTFISFAGIQKREHCSQLWSDVLKFVLTGEIYCVMILMCVTDTYNTMCPDVVEKEKETNKQKKKIQWQKWELICRKKSIVLSCEESWFGHSGINGIRKLLLFSKSNSWR